MQGENRRAAAAQLALWNEVVGPPGTPPAGRAAYGSLGCVGWSGGMAWVVRYRRRSRAIGAAATAPKPACSMATAIATRGWETGAKQANQAVGSRPVTLAVPVLPATWSWSKGNPWKAAKAVPPGCWTAPTNPLSSASWTLAGSGTWAVTFGVNAAEATGAPLWLVARPARRGW